MKYTIQDPQSNCFISNETTTIDNIWYSIGNKKTIKYFDDLIEAKLYLHEISIASEKDWARYGWLYEAKGHTKPKWNIYEMD